MLRHKIAAQIFLITSIFNLVIAAPVVREIYETHDNEVVPVVVRDVEVMSNEWRSSESEGATPSDSSVPPPDRTTPSHSSPPSADKSTPLVTPSALDGSASFRDWLTPPVAGGPASSSLVSSPPGEIVQATDEPVPMHSTLTPQDNTAATGDVLDTKPPSPEAQARMKKLKIIQKVTVAVAAIVFASGLLWQYRHNLHHRTIDPDRYVHGPRKHVP